jgi:uncharacterized protein YggL (DUF469 family)
MICRIRKQEYPMKHQRNPALPSHVAQMNRRQRKKQRVGEFTELGFTLRATLNSELDDAAQDQLLDAWLNLLDQQGVSFGGQFDPSGTLEGVVFPVAARAVDDAVRSTLLDWLKNSKEISSVQASELQDIWHTI